MPINLTTAELSNFLQLSQTDSKHLNICTARYSQSGLNYLLVRLWNAFKSLLCCNTDWDAAHDMLKRKFSKLLVLHYTDIPFYIQKQASSHAAEFVLRYLIDDRCKKREIRSSLIPRSVWIKDIRSEITLDDIFDRAIRGNGRTLPELPKDLTVQLLKKANKVHSHLVESFLKERNPHAYNQAKQEKWETLKTFAKSVKVKIDFDALLSDDDMMNQSLKELSSQLKNTRFATRHFEDQLRSLPR